MQGVIERFEDKHRKAREQTKVREFVPMVSSRIVNWNIANKAVNRTQYDPRGTLNDDDVFRRRFILVLRRRLGQDLEWWNEQAGLSAHPETVCQQYSHTWCLSSSMLGRAYNHGVQPPVANFLNAYFRKWISPLHRWSTTATMSGRTRPWRIPSCCGDVCKEINQEFTH